MGAVNVMLLILGVYARRDTVVGLCVHVYLEQAITAKEITGWLERGTVLRVKHKSMHALKC